MVKSSKPLKNKSPQSQKSKSAVKDGVSKDNAPEAERIAKRMARAGLCSRREAERWIEEGRVVVNGQKLLSPAITVTMKDQIEVDGEPLPAIERTRLWLYHKPSGVMTTNHDPEGRPTLFEKLPKDLPRVITVGRLDMNTEGLLLLTNDGGLARVLELPATGWLRRYRVRVHGKVDQIQLDSLRDGIAVDGVLYGSIEATLDRQQGTNSWLTVALREGKNREIKRVLSAFDLDVTRLIRLSYGPFQLADMKAGEVREIKGRALRDQLGERLAKEAGANFDAPIIHTPAPNVQAGGKPSQKAKPSGAKKLYSDKIVETGRSKHSAKSKPNSRPNSKPNSKMTSSTKRGSHADRRR